MMVVCDEMLLSIHQSAMLSSFFFDGLILGYYRKYMLKSQTKCFPKSMYTNATIDCAEICIVLPFHFIRLFELG